MTKASFPIAFLKCLIWGKSRPSRGPRVQELRHDLAKEMREVRATSKEIRRELAGNALNLVIGDRP